MSNLSAQLCRRIHEKIRDPWTCGIRMKTDCQFDCICYAVLEKAYRRNRRHHSQQKEREIQRIIM